MSTPTTSLTKGQKIFNIILSLVAVIFLCSVVYLTAVKIEQKASKPFQDENLRLRAELLKNKEALRLSRRDLAEEKMDKKLEKLKAEQSEVDASQNSAIDSVEKKADDVRLNLQRGINEALISGQRANGTADRALIAGEEGVALATEAIEKANQNTKELEAQKEVIDDHDNTLNGRPKMSSGR